MRLNPAAFNAFLSGPGGIGQNFLWRSSKLCPCVSPTSGSPSPLCPHCAGKGRLWAAEVPARAGMTQQGIRKEWIAAGLYESGDATITIPEDSPMYEAGQFDRITMLNSTDRFSLPLTHGSPTERLFFKVQTVSEVFWYTGPNDGTGDIVEGGIPAVADDGTLTWSSGEPPAGKQYSISGVKFTEYFIFDGMTSDRGEHYGARLPKKVIARKFDLFGR